MANEFIKSRINHKVSDLVLEAQQAMIKIAIAEISVLKRELAAARAILSEQQGDTSDYINGLIERIAILEQSERLCASLLRDIRPEAGETDVKYFESKVAKLNKKPT